MEVMGAHPLKLSEVTIRASRSSFRICSPIRVPLTYRTRISLNEAAQRPPWPAASLPPGEIHPGRAGTTGRGVPARRGGHGLYCMGSRMAGKCAFPLRRNLPRSKILVSFQGTREWLGALGRFT